MQHESVRGLHLVADIAGASGLGDLPLIEAVLREAAQAARATVLDVRLHHFGPGKGVTGVALLAESHISIHTWPEHGLRPWTSSSAVRRPTPMPVWRCSKTDWVGPSSLKGKS
jgi:S-adenosylmethionine/arginine decarboxylase-like enzyme